MNNSRLSIAMLCESFGALGGVAQVVEDLAAEFAGAGHRVAIISNRHRGNSIARPPNPAVEQVWVELPRAKPISWRHLERLLPRRAAELAAFLKRWRPDVLNIHGVLRDRLPAVLDACHEIEVPLVQSFHLVPQPFSGDPKMVKVEEREARSVLRAARAITFLCAAGKERFEQISQMAQSARIIRNGVNLEAASLAPPYCRERPYIFSASRLDLRHKAVDALIAGFCLIAPEFPQVDLLIAGDGPQRTRLEELISAWSLHARIHLLPPVPHDELWSLYKGALVFVMLSRMVEGLPLVFLEAMICGTPVIGTRNGGTPEIVTHRETGLLVEHNTPREVAAALREMLTDDHLRKRIAHAGQQLIEANYTWGKAAAQFVDLYRECLGQKARPSTA
jgi:glycosyltransferase involved in cell wall biosynthesis